MKKDHVDTVLEQWEKERPDLDSSPMAVMGRLVRTSSFFHAELQKVFSTFSLNSGEFDVLATLLRTGKPYELTPNQLLNTLMLSSGAMTNRVDRLEAKGYVKRSPDPNDRRGVLVSLTDEGYKLISEVIVAHVDKGNFLVSPLSKQEQTELADLLKKLILAHQKNDSSIS
ncbi:MarR family winged helix-turn-helix transcriptional regulator [Flocculibacter collagenilyticus]|uniref:MarR family winged helix-turn-helix transcriptional regulator n=1 Tax=Flocculibacter collagenilyticus TaxID=2744479 RepID=UPI0018F769A1|nr:MarR family transcriptional regulator [Flocculibacter collagenilyticus]